MSKTAPAALTIVALSPSAVPNWTMPLTTAVPLFCQVTPPVSSN